MTHFSFKFQCLKLCVTPVAVEVVQYLLLLWRTQIWFPAPVSGSSQLLAILDVEDLMLSSCLCRCM